MAIKLSTKVWARLVIVSAIVTLVICFLPVRFAMANGVSGSASLTSFSVKTKRIKLAIGGMDCKGCESGIAGELNRTPGVTAATVSYERQEAIVDYDPTQITPAGIVAAIKGAGFTAKLKRG